MSHILPKVKRIIMSTKDPNISFDSSNTQYRQLTSSLQSYETRFMSHTHLESFLTTQGRDLMRTLLSDHLSYRGLGDIGLSLIGSDGITRTYRQIRSRHLVTIFGKIEIKRLMYSYPGVHGICPLDAALNLPNTMFSFGIQKLVAYEVSRGSFKDCIDSIFRQTGVKIARHQIEDIALSSAKDFDGFYQMDTENKAKNSIKKSPLLIITTDSKGIVVRKEDLREQTRKQAEAELKTKRKRLLKGEKKNRKRMSTVASVYQIDRHVRSVDSIIGELKNDHETGNIIRPRPNNKRVWASIEKSQEDVIQEIIQEALKRDPKCKKEWVCLVDGDRRQLSLLKKAIKKYNLNVSLVLDIIHVIEYLWKAVRVFYDETDFKCEKWVSERLRLILEGKSSNVAAGIRRSATLKKIDKEARRPVDKCSDYLIKNAPQLKYDIYLKKGWPIATGVIEGACRHLIKDRMDVTGARWSLEGAEAVLKLRSIKSSGHFEEYWQYHESQEFLRNHHMSYKDPSVIAHLCYKTNKINST
jgi:hypothetical protein